MKLDIDLVYILFLVSGLILLMPYVIDKLEWVQRRAARVVNKNFSREASVTDTDMLRLRTLNWIPLQERRARAKVTTVFKALNNFVDIP